MDTLRGSLGFKGERGYSAYEIAVQHGYRGTEQDWLSTLGTSSHFDQDVITHTTEIANEYVFSLPKPYTSNCFVEVYVEGSRLNSSEFTLDTTTSKVSLTTPLDVVGTKVEVVMFTMSTNNLPIVETINADSTNETAPGTKSVYDNIVMRFITIDVLEENITASDDVAITVSYPTGFTKSNCVVISMMNYDSDGVGYINLDNSTADIPMIESVELDSNITLNVHNYSLETANGTFKITLMKI